MPYYLFTGRYSTDSIKAMAAKPQDREAAARKLIEGIGGKLHHLFFAFGDEDVYARIEAPDDRAMAAGAMVVGASGSMSGGKTIKLMTAKEAMEAAERPPRATHPPRADRVPVFRARQASMIRHKFVGVHRTQGPAIADEATRRIAQFQTR